MCPPIGFEGVARSATPTGKRAEAVRVWLLGSFRVSVGRRIIEEDAWRLRKAAAVVKLLALAPDHRLIVGSWELGKTRARGLALRKEEL
jgi:hypothetical protein